MVLALALGLVVPGSEFARGQSADPGGKAGEQRGKLDGLDLSQAGDARLDPADAIIARWVGLAGENADKGERRGGSPFWRAGVPKHGQAVYKAGRSGGERLGLSLADVLADALWRKRVVDALYRHPDGRLAKDIAD